MKSEFIKLYNLAKLNSLEILIEERIQYVGSSQSRFFETYFKNQQNLRKKVIITKIFSSIIFSILPLIPLLTFFQIDDSLTSGLFSIDVIVFAGSLLFSLYFLLQFFNFFLLGIFNVSLIISGRIFRWYETFPLPREKLRKLVHLTIFRSLDLPIIISILAFPLLMLIGTLNILLFVICFCVSFLNTFFSFNLLILVGERINRNLDINEIGSRKTFGIRMFNMFSYLIIIVLSVYAIQWAIGSLNIFFTWFLNVENSSLINQIFSLIVFPFTPSYLVSLFIDPLAVPPLLWGTSLIGVGIFILLAYRIYINALIKLERKVYTRFDLRRKSIQDLKKNLVNSHKIKVRSPFAAFILKDFLTASRNLKTFMAFIMPVVLSFVFKFSFNLATLRITAPIESNLLSDWFITICFNVILAAMIIYNILNIEESGETILVSLPIVHRDQAKAKLLLIISIQFLALILPNIMYISDSLFIEKLLISIAALPPILLFLFVIFEMRIYYLGKLKNHYVLTEISTQDTFFKWFLIILANLFFCIWFIVIALSFFYTTGIQSMVGFIIAVHIICIFYLYLAFNSLFPKNKIRIISEIKTPLHQLEKSEKKKIPTWFSMHIWTSIVILLILNYIFLNLVLIISQFLFATYYERIEFEIAKIGSIFFFNMTYFCFLIILIPKYFGLPTGKQPLSSYIDEIGLHWLRRISKQIVLGLIFAILFLFFVSLFIGMISSYESIQYFIYFDTAFYAYLITISLLFWYELLFRGVILKLLLNKYNNNKAIMISSVLYTFFVLGTNLIIPFYYLNVSYYIIIIKIIFLFIMGCVFAKLKIKTQNLLPNLILLTLMIFFGLEPLIS